MSKLSIDRFFRINSENFEVIRDGEVSHELEGMKNREEEGKQRRFIGFRPNVDVQRGDWVRSKQTGDKFFIYETEGTTGLRGEQFQTKALFKTEAEYEREEEKTEGPVFQVDRSPGSVIGTQEQAEITNINNWGEIHELIDANVEGEEKEELKQFISDLEEKLENGEVGQGDFKKYADIIAKHGWLSGPISQMIMTWLVGG